MYPNQKPSYAAKPEPQTSAQKRRAAICSVLRLNSTASNQDIENETFNCYKKLGIPRKAQNPVNVFIFEPIMQARINFVFLREARLVANNPRSYSELITAWSKILKLYLVATTNSKYLSEDYNNPKEAHALLIKVALNSLPQESLSYPAEEINELFKPLSDYLKQCMGLTQALNFEHKNFLSEQINNLMRFYEQEENPGKKSMMQPFLVNVIIFILSENIFQEQNQRLLNYFAILNAKINSRFEAQTVPRNDAQKLVQHGTFKTPTSVEPVSEATSLVPKADTSRNCHCAIL